jgi:uncharacterized protein YjbJ (UPF0337 family)
MPKKGLAMATSDKARNKGQKLRGKAKEIIGRVTRDARLEAQGKDAQRGADLKDAGEKVKDVIRPKGPRRRRPAR